MLGARCLTPRPRRGSPSSRWGAAATTSTATRSPARWSRRACEVDDDVADADLRAGQHLHVHRAGAQDSIDTVLASTPRPRQAGPGPGDRLHGAALRRRARRGAARGGGCARVRGLPAAAGDRVDGAGGRAGGSHDARHRRAGPCRCSRARRRVGRAGRPRRTAAFPVRTTPRGALGVPEDRGRLRPRLHVLHDPVVSAAATRRGRSTSCWPRRGGWSPAACASWSASARTRRAGARTCRAAAGPVRPDPRCSSRIEGLERVRLLYLQPAEMHPAAARRDGGQPHGRAPTTTCPCSTPRRSVLRADGAVRRSPSGSSTSSPASAAATRRRCSARRSSPASRARPTPTSRCSRSSSRRRGWTGRGSSPSRVEDGTPSATMPDQVPRRRGPARGASRSWRPPRPSPRTSPRPGSGVSSTCWSRSWDEGAVRAAAYREASGDRRRGAPGGGGRWSTVPVRTSCGWWSTADRRRCDLRRGAREADGAGGHAWSRWSRTGSTSPTRFTMLRVALVPVIAVLRVRRGRDGALVGVRDLRVRGAHRLRSTAGSRAG